MYTMSPYKKNTHWEPRYPGVSVDSRSAAAAPSAAARSSYTFPKQLESGQPERGLLSAEDALRAAISDRLGVMAYGRGEIS